MLNSIQIVLVEPSHPGNIGAVARAMKNMGLCRLTLVLPEKFPHPEATARASGADDILRHAKVVSSLQEAIGACHWVYGTSARTREFPWPQLTPDVAAKAILEKSNQQEIAIVFGPERAGLTNEALQACDFHIAILTNPEYSSLNLAQAVQVIAYELFKQAQGEIVPQEAEDKATSEEVAGLLAHFEQAALALNFMDGNHPKKLMPKLRRLFAKAQLEKDEINILRGFLKQVMQGRLF